MALSLKEKAFQMRRLNQLFKEVAEDAIKAGLPYKAEKVNPKIQINNRTTAVGLCKYSKVEKQYTIYYSSYYLNIPDDKIKNTLMHELIHTLPDCWNHQAEFKRFMYRVNSNKYLSMTYHVDTRNRDKDVSAACDEQKQILLKKDQAVRVVCSCGCEYIVKKTQKVAKQPQNYQCRKHGLTLHLAK